MKPPNSANSARQTKWLLSSLLVLTVAYLLWPRKPDRPANQSASGDTTQADLRSRLNLRNHAGFQRQSPAFPGHAHSAAAVAPEQIVAAKLTQFARSRRQFAIALARRHQVQVPPDVGAFFDAVESGDWDGIEAAFNKINGGDSSAGRAPNRPPGVEHLWPAIIDAYGVAEQVHLWPAQQLLDYGQAILDALRPGMVYVGGTDNGRWIPELLNETSEGERHIVITQNGLADATYLDYLRLQYDDRLATLSPEDCQRAFQGYVSDAQARLQHDQQFPNEPKQLNPGEDVRMVNGKIEIGGQTAVMAINERLLQTLMQKNPEMSFALQESFPFRSTYEDALPLGPLMELRARDDRNTFTAERAGQTIDYWRSLGEQILSDPQAVSSPAVLKSYSHDTVAAANLLGTHNFSAQAEQGYRLATQLWPGNPESVSALADLLARGGRADEARQLLTEFTRGYPEERKTLERLQGNSRIIISTPQASP